MINERLKRLRKDRPSTTITMRIPADVVGSLKAIAPTTIFMKMYRYRSCRCPSASRGEEFVVRHQLGKAAHLSNGSRIHGFERSLPVLL